MNYIYLFALSCIAGGLIAHLVVKPLLLKVVNHYNFKDITDEEYEEWKVKNEID